MVGLILDTGQMGKHTFTELGCHSFAKFCYNCLLKFQGPARSVSNSRVAHRPGELPKSSSSKPSEGLAAPPYTSMQIGHGHAV